MVTPAARREAVAHLEQGYEMSERRACSLIGADRSSVRYLHRRTTYAELRDELRKAAEKHRRFGYRRLHVILRRDGHVLNRKRTQRLYREEGLSVRRRRSRKRAIGTRAPLVTEALANARWSVDFVQDQFADGRRFRILNVIDDVTKESLAAVDFGKGWHPQRNYKQQTINTAHQSLLSMLCYHDHQRRRGAGGGVTVGRSASFSASPCHRSRSRSAAVRRASSWLMVAVAAARSSRAVARSERACSNWSRCWS